MIVTLTVSDLKNLISEILEEKFLRINAEHIEPKKETSLISRIEVAKLFGVSKTTIDKWIKWKILPPVIKMCSRVYFEKELINELIFRRQKKIK